MVTRAQADRALAAHDDWILENPNVVSISVIETDDGDHYLEIGLIAAEADASVDPPSDDAVQHRAPDSLPIPPETGAPNDAAETIQVRKRVTGVISTRSFTGRKRPAAGGDSCGPSNSNWAGTIGARVERNGTAYILSNWHVLYGGVGQDNTAILQPGPLDGGENPENVIGYNAQGNLSDFLDAAIAEIRTPADAYVQPGTQCYGPIGGTSLATDRMEVQKCGRTTEGTRGKISSTNSTVRVSGYPSGDRTFRQQLQIAMESAKGDSGAIILEQDNGLAVGLLFASGDSDTYANRIQDVIEEFGIEFATE